MVKGIYEGFQKGVEELLSAILQAPNLIGFAFRKFRDSFNELILGLIQGDILKAVLEKSGITKRIEEFTSSLYKGGVSKEAFNEFIGSLQNQALLIAETVGGMIAPLRRELIRAKEIVRLSLDEIADKGIGEPIERAVESIKSGFSEIIKAVLTGAKGARDAFAEMALKIREVLLDTFLQILINSFILTKDVINSLTQGIFEGLRGNFTILEGVMSEVFSRMRASFPLVQEYLRMLNFEFGVPLPAGENLVNAVAPIEPAGENLVNAVAPIEPAVVPRAAMGFATVTGAPITGAPITNISASFNFNHLTYEEKRFLMDFGNRLQDTKRFSRGIQ